MMCIFVLSRILLALMYVIYHSADSSNSSEFSDQANNIRQQLTSGTPRSSASANNPTTIMRGPLAGTSQFAALSTLPMNAQRFGPYAPQRPRSLNPWSGASANNHATIVRGPQPGTLQFPVPSTPRPPFIDQLFDTYGLEGLGISKHARNLHGIQMPPVHAPNPQRFTAYEQPAQSTVQVNPALHRFAGALPHPTLQAQQPEEAGASSAACAGPQDTQAMRGPSERLIGPLLSLTRDEFTSRFPGATAVLQPRVNARSMQRFPAIHHGLSQQAYSLAEIHHQLGNQIQGYPTQPCRHTFNPNQPHATAATCNQDASAQLFIQSSGIRDQVGTTYAAPSTASSGSACAAPSSEELTRSDGQYDMITRNFKVIADIVKDAVLKENFIVYFNPNMWEDVPKDQNDVFCVLNHVLLAVAISLIGDFVLSEDVNAQLNRMADCKLIIRGVFESFNIDNPIVLEYLQGSSTQNRVVTADISNGLSLLKQETTDFSGSDTIEYLRYFIANLLSDRKYVPIAAWIDKSKCEFIITDMGRLTLAWNIVTRGKIDNQINEAIGAMRVRVEEAFPETVAPNSNVHRCDPVFVRMSRNIIVKFQDAYKKKLEILCAGRYFLVETAAADVECAPRDETNRKEEFGTISRHGPLPPYK